jgi:hypothetical protein
MTVQSPFGQYAPLVAIFAAAAVIVAFLIAVATDNVSAQQLLEQPFVFVLGSVFGSAVAIPAINGHVAAQVKALNARADAAGLPPADGKGLT